MTNCKRCCVQNLKRKQCYKWNAKIGKLEDLELLKKIGLGKCNAAGDRLRELCKKNYLYIANIFFKQSPVWTSLEGH